MTDSDPDRLRRLRREFHRRPEPAWREYWTTARVVSELDRIGVDDVFVGPDVLASDARAGLPDQESHTEWLDRARDAGVDDGRLDQLADGHTGAIAVVEGTEPGPTTALRVDIDALPITESTAAGHAPTEGEFRSTNEGYMHACGHDAHATIGLGVAEALAASEFPGRLKVIFQPAEEVVGGGEAVAEGGHVDDVDALLALHVGLDHPTGEVVAGIDEFLAVHHFRAEFRGESAHAGAHPAAGRNAVQAMAAAVQNLGAIARHEDGATRVNAGKVGGGTASNIVPESAFVEGEVRGETTALMEYMREEAARVLRGAAEMYGCTVDVETVAEAPSASSDDAVVDVVEAVAGATAGVDSVVRNAPLGGSEDATFLMRRVQERGGDAAFVCVGTDHPGGHHTPTFDVDEATLQMGVSILSETIERLARERRDG
jgi:aminobenzoyl-glutamate utilization protein A